MLLDAIVLTGGRSSRLSGFPKAELRIGAASLAKRTLDAVSSARHTVVVGTVPPSIEYIHADAGVTVTREVPAFGGPVAALRAGVSVLEARPDPADAVLVLACDLVHVDRIVPLLLEAADGMRPDGVVACGDGRRQWLTALYALPALHRAFERIPPGEATDMAMKTLLAGLDCTDLDLPAALTDDIDTWEDARRVGAVPDRPPQ